MRADTTDVFKRRKLEAEETVDVAARLNPYEELFNEAMAMAARFAEQRPRRDGEAAAAHVAPPARQLGRRAS